jgi:branched-chain amino acid transport system permease protein
MGAARLGFPVEASGEPAYCSGAAKYVFSQINEGGVISPLEITGIVSVAVALAILVSSVGGVMASYPAVRLRGDFLAITLLAMGEIVRLIAYNSPWPVCAFDGLSGIPSPFAVLGLEHNLSVAVTALVALALVYLYVSRATNSPWGRALKAVRDNEIAAMVYGYNPSIVRLQALAVGSGLAGLAGALLVIYSGNVNAISFKPDKTFEVIAAVMLGGSANNLGSLVGAAIIAGLLVFLNASSLNAIGIDVPAGLGQALPYIKFTVIGLIIVLVLMFRPQGIMPEKPLKTPMLKRLVEKYGRKGGKGGE